MIIEKVQAPVIQAGYEWSIRLDLEGYEFPEEATFVAQVRRAPNVDDVLVELTTANLKIKRINSTTLDIFIRAEDSLEWPERKVYLDVVRTDLNIQDHLGFMLVIPVRVPITRGVV